MRAIRKLFGLSSPKKQNIRLMESSSLAAFGQLSDAQQSMLAEVLVSEAQRRRLDKAS